MHQIKIILPLIFLFVSTEVCSQYFLYGDEPASVRWEQIHTDHFQVIYPESFEEKGNYVANILEFAYDEVSYSLDHKPKKISVIVHNKNVMSNGFVAPAPDRMELFTTPPQRTSITPWLEKLIIHEIRHVVQIDKLDQGITKILSYIFGEQATGATAGLIPMWFFEGDAVISETALTHGGRGRTPSFSNILRANVLDTTRDFNFNKMLLGSYRNNTPNHYTLGYYMTSYARQKYGTKIWSDVIDYASRKPYFLFSFNLGLKKHTGQYSGGLYDASLNFYDSLWSANNQQLDEKVFSKINQRRDDDFESYRFPHYAGEDSVIAKKSGFSHIDQFVLITRGREEVLFEPGIMTSEDFAYASDKIVWAEKISDLRWEHRSYSVIKLYDLQTRKEYQLSEKSRLFAPSLSPDGTKIVAVHITEKNEYSLVILNSETGNILKRFSSAENMFLQRPAWAPDGKSLFVITQTSEGKSVFNINYRTGDWSEFITPVFEGILNISPGEEYLYFHSTWNNKDNLYAKHYQSGKIFRLTDSRLGAVDISYASSPDELYFSEYTSHGYDIKKAGKSRLDFIEFTGEEKGKEPVIEKLKAQEPGIIQFDSRKFVEYESEKYQKWKHLFNFHSWAPIYFDHNQIMHTDFEFSPGITLLSQNDLSTMVSSVGYSYQSGTHGFHTSVTYRGLYPVINISSDYGAEPLIYRIQDVEWVPYTSNDNLNLNLEVSLPLDFTSGKYITRFTPSVEYEYSRNYFYNYKEDFYLRGLKTIDYQLYFQSYKRLAFRDINPELGILLNFNLRSSPFNENIFGNMLSLQGKVFLPGLFEDHGTSVTYGYQTQNPELYLFGGYLGFPRGFESQPNERLNVFRGDYVMPLFYPDWSLGSLLYIKRFKADLFYDFGRSQIRRRNTQTGSIDWVTRNYESFGAEITTDFHFMRVMFPLSAGVRYIYKPAFSESSFEFVFDIDLFSIYNRQNKY